MAAAAQRLRRAGLPEDLRGAIGGWADGKRPVLSWPHRIVRSTRSADRRGRGVLHALCAHRAGRPCTGADSRVDEGSTQTAPAASANAIKG